MKICLPRLPVKLLVFTSILINSIASATTVNLFNGQDLEGWDVIVKDKGIVQNQEIFKVENGVIHVYPDQEHNSEQPYAGLTTQKEYAQYHLSLEYKWGKKKFVPRHEFVRDAGIMFHLFGEDVIWPNSLECQIQEGDTGDIWIVGAKASSKVQPTIRNYSPTGKIVTRGPETGGRFNRFHRGYCWEKEGWNKVEVIVNASHAIFKVNGKVVNEIIDAQYPDPQTGEWKALTTGRIMLQAEGAEIFYRDIKITEL